MEDTDVDDRAMLQEKLDVAVGSVLQMQFDLAALGLIVEALVREFSSNEHTAIQVQAAISVARQRAGALDVSSGRFRRGEGTLASLNTLLSAPTET